MNSTEEFLIDSFQEKPIDNTEHFTLVITNIGVVAIF